MAYIDGFVIPVHKDKLDAYRKLARKASKVWMAHGAVSYVESVSDDVKPGKLTSFPQSVMLEPDELVVFAYITYKSRAHRDKVMAKVMQDPLFAGPPDMANMPFDGKRMIFGGFKVMISV